MKCLSDKTLFYWGLFFWAKVRECSIINAQCSMPKARTDNKIDLRILLS